MPLPVHTTNVFSGIAALLPALRGHTQIKHCPRQAVLCGSVAGLVGATVPIIVGSQLNRSGQQGVYHVHNAIGSENVLLNDSHAVVERHGAADPVYNDGKVAKQGCKTLPLHKVLYYQGAANNVVPASQNAIRNRQEQAITCTTVVRMARQGVSWLAV